MKRAIAWFFASSEAPHTLLRVVWWWEQRRIPFNLLVGAYAILCFTLFLLAILTSGVLKPGEDAIEPLAIVVAPFVVNAAYTLGWIVEVSARMVNKSISPRFAPKLLGLGVAFGLVLITMPAA